MKVDATISNTTIANVATKQPVQKEQLQAEKFPGSDKNKLNEAKEATDQISLNITVSKRTLETIEKLGEVSDVLNSMAKSLRQTDQTLKYSAEMIARMKADLGKIVKNFPPFPTDSIERRDLLMSYSAIQKEIAKMSVPQPPPPAYEQVQHQWQNLIPGLDGKVATPELSEKSSDAQVRFALDALGAITERIDGIRNEIGATFS